MRGSRLDLLPRLRLLPPAPRLAAPWAEEAVTHASAARLFSALQAVPEDSTRTSLYTQKPSLCPQPYLLCSGGRVTQEEVRANRNRSTVLFSLLCLACNYLDSERDGLFFSFPFTASSKAERLVVSRSPVGESSIFRRLQSDPLSWVLQTPGVWREIPSQGKARLSRLWNCCLWRTPLVSHPCPFCASLSWDLTNISKTPLQLRTAEF